jgi:hypothetical protein
MKNLTPLQEHKITIFLKLCIITILSLFGTLLFLQMNEPKPTSEPPKRKSDIVRPFVKIHGGDANCYGLINGYWVYCDSLRVFRVEDYRK